MRDVFPLMCVVLSLCFHSHAQSIMAGIAGQNDYYYNFNPNDTVTAWVPINSATDSILLDANGDGDDDFSISVYYDDNGQWGTLTHYRIEPLNNNEVAISHIDTCYMTSDSTLLSTWPMLIAHEYGDSVKIDSEWTNDQAYWAYDEFNGLVGNGYLCSDGNFGTEFRYAGIRVYTATDTLYGWIQAKLGSTAQLIMNDFACNTFTVSLDEIESVGKELLEIVDLIGRPAKDAPNQLLIYIYSDGSTEKVIRVE